jgi:hypothetical protein
MRYSLLGADLADARQLFFPERYRLEFWREELRESAVLVNRSASVRYWIVNATLDALAREFEVAWTRDSEDQRDAYITRGLEELDRLGAPLGADADVDDWRVKKLVTTALALWTGGNDGLTLDERVEKSQRSIAGIRLRVLELARQRAEG